VTPPLTCTDPGQRCEHAAPQSVAAICADQPACRCLIEIGSWTLVAVLRCSTGEASSVEA
jgi:hypothetical protein